MEWLSREEIDRRIKELGYRMGNLEAYIQELMWTEEVGTDTNRKLAEKAVRQIEELKKKRADYQLQRLVTEE